MVSLSVHFCCCCRWSADPWNKIKQTLLLPGKLHDVKSFFNQGQLMTSRILRVCYLFPLSLSLCFDPLTFWPIEKRGQVITAEDPHWLTVVNDDVTSFWVMTHDDIMNDGATRARVWLVVFSKTEIKKTKWSCCYLFFWLYINISPFPW